ncbi:uncharacterized protein STEHIDRAFT_170175 [Stereum hirsutum FP-91666 SS1]|uniref:uncharacterized protein n=1 Tax=Stereum hirsutum (strain FP-91666) TaxID=721885 RepID=UPI0004449691|nr:uncharacterized protein STEHIDRAFT_170175 [Stereum hirsutum FP-91666 SS1]EIM84490.1 hypothetical protein STEHIDRAFT_170175 [Stereum hirsutum FP-91666 SS1]
MAEPRFKSPPPSHIPVISPRRSETMTSLPSSLNVPNLGLVPPNRRPSGSAGSPSVTFQSTPPITSTNTGFHSLRNLRNFLPFGNTKIQTPSGNATGYGVTTANSGSANKKLGAVRRSMVVDRKPSWTSTSGDGSQSGEQDEVIVIDHGRDGRSASESSQISADTRRSLSPPAPPPKDLGPPIITYTPDPPLSTELSTIIEADLSGLSKHFASDSSQGEDTSRGEETDGEDDEAADQDADPTETRPIIQPQPKPATPSTQAIPRLPSFGDFYRNVDAAHSGTPVQRTSSSRHPAESSTSNLDDSEHDQSGFDLSTSQLPDEVFHALKQKQSRSGDGWLADGVVIDATGSTPPEAVRQNEAQDADEDVSFRLDALDPELAVLLSPNRIGRSPLHSPAPPDPATRTVSTSTPPPRQYSPHRAVFSPRSLNSPTRPGPSSLPPSSTHRSPSRAAFPQSSPTGSIHAPAPLARTSTTFSRPLLNHAARSSSSVVTPRFATGRISPLRGVTNAPPSSNYSSPDVTNTTGFTRSSSEGYTAPLPNPGSSPRRQLSEAQTQLYQQQQQQQHPHQLGSPLSSVDTLPPVRRHNTGGESSYTSPYSHSNPSQSQSQLSTANTSRYNSYNASSSTFASSTSKPPLPRLTTPSRSTLNGRYQPASVSGAGSRPASGSPEGKGAKNGSEVWERNTDVNSVSPSSRSSTTGVPPTATARRLNRLRRTDDEHRRPSLQLDRDGHAQMHTQIQGRLGPSISEFGVVGSGGMRRDTSVSRLGYFGTAATRNRKRSLSMSESRGFGLGQSGTGQGLLSPRGPGLKTDWMGPRTVKALTAAGLLDRDRERERDREVTSPASTSANTGVGSAGTSSRPGSRFGFGSVQSYGGAEAREYGAPSRMAFSEAGSGSTRSGSVSRAMTTVSDDARGSVHARTRSGSLSTGVGVGGGMGPVETPRTTYSTSTAPTSVVASNGLGGSSTSGGPSPKRSQNQAHQTPSSALIQSLHEKHSMETSALLSALADSQRGAQGLRDENARLDERVRELEAALEDAHALARRYQGVAERQGGGAAMRERRLDMGYANSEWEWERERELEMERDMRIGSGVGIRGDGRMETRYTERDSMPSARSQPRTVLNRVGGGSSSRPASSDGPVRPGSSSYRYQTPARERLYGHAAPPKSMSLSVAAPQSREPSRSPLLQLNAIDMDPDEIDDVGYQIDDDDTQQRAPIRGHGHGPVLSFMDDNIDSLQPGHARNGDNSLSGSSEDTSYRTHRQRPSATSSVFAMPPPEMTLLMQENSLPGGQPTFNSIGDVTTGFSLGDLHAMSRPRSGTASTSGSGRPQASHRPHASDGSSATSVRSVGRTAAAADVQREARNVSPTTMASFSMAGSASPGSLSLRTEHELHLADIDAMSLADMYGPIAGSEDGDEDDR